jgi:hypothetical protein
MARKSDSAPEHATTTRVRTLVDVDVDVAAYAKAHDIPTHEVYAHADTAVREQVRDAVGAAIDSARGGWATLVE